eukprot:scpid90208/ scgid7498/ Elongation of very long chain fatty acids protein 4; 3-keto acyl-CoA synthase Elovl4; ELOVL fatty acid elongase 4
MTSSAADPLAQVMDRANELFQVGQAYWEEWQSKADPRTADWFMVKDPTYLLMALAGYIAFVLIVPRIMNYCRPFDLKPIMLVYNFAIASLSLYMCIEFLSVGLHQNWMCAPVDHSTSEFALRACRITHIFYLSKFIEFLDTVFFILRKKNNQVSFLHVYHHVSITIMWYILSTWYPNGSVFFSGMLNSSVHVCMYSYYFLSALGPALQPYLWWKRYLTRFQILQFVAISIHNSFNMPSSCAFPTWIAHMMTGYMVSLILLFSNFYFKAYKKPTAAAGSSGKKKTN